MHLVDEYVQDPYAVTSIEESIHDVAPDEAGATRYENRFTQFTTPLASTLVLYMPAAGVRLCNSGAEKWIAMPTRLYWSVHRSAL